MTWRIWSPVGSTSSSNASFETSSVLTPLLLWTTRGSSSGDGPLSLCARTRSRLRLVVLAQLEVACWMRRAPSAVGLVHHRLLMDRNMGGIQHRLFGTLSDQSSDRGQEKISIRIPSGSKTKRA
jgi:hypothetical protein